MKGYPRYVQRSMGSAAGHFALLVVLASALSAAMVGQWIQAHVTPTLKKVAADIPAITVRDGVASVNLPQPHVIMVDSTPVVIIDTTADPQVHLDQHEAIVVLSARHLVSRDSQGKVESYPLPEQLDLSSQRVAGWVDQATMWAVPVIFLGILGWQMIWKFLQVLLVAGVVTLIHSSRPGFAVHLKLAVYSLGPAMTWGLFVFAARVSGLTVPLAGVFFWVILFGMTALVAGKMRKGPEYA